ncbi:hypothetical protein K1719_031201 [Acacia pycnantha]|nr:hypothetical protein K1719_031201 [Acacia pycnantha]
MASEAVLEGAEVVATSTEAVAADTISKHNLDRKWTFWFDNQTKPKQSAAWGTLLRKGDDICGVVASVRQRQDKISLCTKTATNEAAQMSIGRKWKEIIDANDKIHYNAHDDSKRDRSAKSRYSV